MEAGRRDGVSELGDSVDRWPFPATVSHQRAVHVEHEVRSPHRWALAAGTSSPVAQPRVIGSARTTQAMGAPDPLRDVSTPSVGVPCDADAVVVEFDAELWIWDARRADSWTFVTLPAAVSEEIRELADGPRRGFGSLRAQVTVGGSTWRTSIFPDSSRGYVLPIKRAVRKAEALEAGDVATVRVELIDV